MKTGANYEIKGWCPGALRPMPSGDGLLVRVRPRLGVCSPKELSCLASAARSFGNGQIDLTRRANLQIRGVNERTFEPLLDVLARLDLLDPSPAAEAARNLVVSPLAGIDPLEVLDMRPVARELLLYAAKHAEVLNLPGKFGFVLDGNGCLPLAAERADVRLLAMQARDGPVVLVGLDHPKQTDWLGVTEPVRSADLAWRIVEALHSERLHGELRARDLKDQERTAIKSMLANSLVPLEFIPEAQDTVSARQLGVLDLGNDTLAVAIAAPFGRIESGQLDALAAAFTQAGAVEIRLSPWRTLYAAVRDRTAGRVLCNRAQEIGLIIESGDPLRRVDACPGAPACGSTQRATRKDARRLSQRLSGTGFSGTLHISGCAKGCARSARADITLVGDEHGYAVILNGNARDAACASLNATEIDSVVDMRGKIGSNRQHE